MRGIAQLLDLVQAPPSAVISPNGHPADPELAEVVANRLLREANAEQPSGQYDFEFGRPYNSQLRHLSGSEYELRELSWTERVEVWRRAHQAWERNPWAKGALRMIRNFTVGQGHTVTCRAARVQEVLDAFRADPANAISRYDKAFCEQLLLDGELFIRLSIRAADGRVVIDPIPPWWVEEIELDPDFRQRVVAYHVRFRRGRTLSTVDAGQELVPVAAARLVHVAINRLGYEVRGRSELFAILPWLKAYKDWLEDRARTNRYKGALYYIVQLSGGTAAQVAAKRSQYRTPPPPGSILVATDKEKWETVEPRIGAPDVAEDGRQLKLAAAVGVGLPEYALSDGSNSNRATSSSQQLPALAMFADYQDLLAEQLWMPLYAAVIAAAQEAGLLGETEPAMDANGEPVLLADGSPQEVRSAEAFEVGYPDIQEPDPKNLSEALAIQLTQGLISQETAMRELGRDPAVERKRIDAEEAAEATRVGQGLAIGARRPEPVGGRPQEPSESPEDEEVA